MRNLVPGSSAVRKVADSPPVRKLVEPVLGPNAFVARSLLFDKTAEANWKVAWHQDPSRLQFAKRLRLPDSAPGR